MVPSLQSAVAEGGASVARALHREVGFDVVHHLTWAGFRVPTFLGSLGPPLILGPIGGGETSPRFTPRRVSSARQDFREDTRFQQRNGHDQSLDTPRVDRGRRHFRIHLRYPDLFSRSVKNKTFVFTPLWITNPPLLAPRMARQGPPQLLCAARLYYWKGVHIAIRAFAQLSKRCPEARFTIVGRGPEEHRLKAEAAGYGVADHIDFV